MLRELKEVFVNSSVCSTILEKSKRMNEENKGRVQVRGPRRMPTKVLRLTTRKAPGGNGTNTWDRFEMRIHKRVIHLIATRTDFKDLAKIDILPGMIV